MVSAAEDDDGETDAPVTLTHAVRGGDYDRLRADNVRVTIKETDRRGIIVDADPSDDALTSAMPAIAEGGTGTYRVKLESKPTGTVTVTVSRHVGRRFRVSVAPDLHDQRLG